MDSQHQILAPPLPAQLDRYATPLSRFPATAAPLFFLPLILLLCSSLYHFLCYPLFLLLHWLDFFNSNYTNTIATFSNHISESVVFGLGKFYGTSLPRCRIYIDVKCNDRLVDPQFASPSTLPHIVHEDTADLNVGGVSNRSGRRQHARQIWTLTMWVADL